MDTPEPEPNDRPTPDRPAGPPARASGVPPLLLRRDQVALVVLGAVLLGWLAWDWLDVSRWGTPPVEFEEPETVEAFGLRLDPNTATWIELAQLPGVGDALAQRIVEERKRGRFSSVGDLRRVKGIGPKLLERIEPYLYFSPASQERDQP